MTTVQPCGTDQKAQWLFETAALALLGFDCLVFMEASPWADPWALGNSDGLKVGTNS